MSDISLCFAHTATRGDIFRFRSQLVGLVLPTVILNIGMNSLQSQGYTSIGFVDVDKLCKANSPLEKLHLFKCPNVCISISTEVVVTVILGNKLVFHI